MTSKRQCRFSGCYLACRELKGIKSTIIRHTLISKSFTTKLPLNVHPMVKCSISNTPQSPYGIDCTCYSRITTSNSFCSLEYSRHRCISHYSTSIIFNIFRNYFTSCTRCSTCNCFIHSKRCAWV